MSVYRPKFLAWCTSYDQEVRELTELIEGDPGDLTMLKKEFKELTGKRYKSPHSKIYNKYLDKNFLLS